MSKHCKVPKITSTNAAIIAANDLLNTLQNPSPALPNLQLTTTHYEALKWVAKIMMM